MDKKNQEKPVEVRSGENFTETYAVAEKVTIEPSLHISQEAFLLCEADFLRIKFGGSRTDGWASRFVIAAVLTLFSPAAKQIQLSFLGTTSLSIEAWEWIPPFAGFGIAILLLLLGKFLPNEKERVMKDVEAHFSDAPRQRHLEERKK